MAKPSSLAGATGSTALMLALIGFLSVPTDVGALVQDRCSSPEPWNNLSSVSHPAANTLNSLIQHVSLSSEVSPIWLHPDGQSSAPGQMLPARVYGRRAAIEITIPLNEQMLLRLQGFGSLKEVQDIVSPPTPHHRALPQ